MLRGNLRSPRSRLQGKDNALKFLIAMLALASLACNAFAGNLEPFPEPPTVDSRPSATEKPQSATPSPTQIDAGAPVVSILVNLNVRSGPGLQYDRVGFLSQGASAAVIGADKSSGWWKIDCPASLSVNECWVSGGSQFVTANNMQDVPTAVAPPTPTTIPPTVEVGHGLLAYIDGGRLFVASLNLGQDPPELAQDPRQVSTADGVEHFAFSPDGRRIAYTAGSESTNSLNVVNVDGGDHRTLVSSNILPLAVRQESSRTTVLIDTIHWLPDGSSVAFNTRVQNLDGPGGINQEDLWLATLEGELANTFPAGGGGGAFVMESATHVLLSRAAEIARGDLRTGEQEILLQFDPINTASEYIYYPIPQLTARGTYLAVPAQDPWPAEAETTLWRMLVNTPAIEIGRLAAIPLDQPVSWSSDGRLTSFIRRSNSEEQPFLRMYTAEGDGSSAVPYAGGAELNFLAWKPGDEQFLYAGMGFYAVGRPQAPPVQLLMPAGQIISQGDWLKGDNFVVVIIDPANQGWQIQSANTSGETRLLANGTGGGPAIAVWYQEE
ncbi:MAG: SH3 domain-containing protein [Candidatus Promineifilaceae bacterium]